MTKVDAAERGSLLSLRNSEFLSGAPPVYFQCTCTRSGVYRNHTAPGSAPRARAGGGSTTLIRSLRILHPLRPHSFTYPRIGSGWLVATGRYSVALA